MSANHPEMHTDASRKVDIICQAAQIVLENGGETYRVEETAQRMAQGLGMDHLSIAAFPTSIFIEAEERARVRRILPAHPRRYGGGRRPEARSPPWSED